MTALQRDIEEDRMARERLGPEAEPKTRQGNTPRFINIKARLPGDIVVGILGSGFMRKSIAPCDPAARNRKA